MHGKHRQHTTPRFSTLDRHERVTETPNSVEVKMNAKGERYWDIKVYYAPGHHRSAATTVKRMDRLIADQFEAERAQK